MLDNLLSVVSLVGWIGFALLVLILSLRAFQVGGMREVLNALLSVRVLAAFVVVVAITLLSASLVFIEPQQIGVVVSLTSQDGYRQQPLRSGLHWIIPLAEYVERYPIYWQNYTMSNAPLEGEKIGDDSIAARTSDGQSVFVDSSVIFRIDGNEVLRVHIDWQTRYIDDFIRPVMRGIIRTEVSQFTADEVNSSKRKNLEANLDELLREEFSDKGFVLDRFLLRNIAFSPEYANAIEQKQVAEQERTQREYEAEQMRKLAEGSRDKQIIEAAGRATAIVLEGSAQAEVIRQVASAEAQAITVKAEALDGNQDLITFWYVDKLAPGVRVMLVPNDNPYILPLPDLTEEMDLELVTPTPTTTGDLDISTPIPGTLILEITEGPPSMTPTPTATPSQ